MAKKVTGQIKLQITAGRANPSPPIGPALGAAGVNIPLFCKEFNARTQSMASENIVVPVVITVYSDRTFIFQVKTPPTAALIKKALKLEKGSGEPKTNKVGKVTDAQLEEIAQTKMPDLNAHDIEAAKKIVAGTARSMGIEVEG